MTAMDWSLAPATAAASRPRRSLGAVLEDGTYDALVFDADEAEAGGVAVELTILSGEHKGEVVSVVSAGWRGDALDLLGIPATLTVTEGKPQVTFEP
jgi:hypothetical protein